MKLVNFCNSQYFQNGIEHYGLFNLTSDPFETQDLSERMDFHKRKMYLRLRKVQSEQAPFPLEYFKFVNFTTFHSISHGRKVEVISTSFC